MRKESITLLLMIAFLCSSCIGVRSDVDGNAAQTDGTQSILAYDSESQNRDSSGSGSLTELLENEFSKKLKLANSDVESDLRRQAMDDVVETLLNFPASGVDWDDLYYLRSGIETLGFDFVEIGTSIPVVVIGVFYPFGAAGKADGNIYIAFYQINGALQAIQVDHYGSCAFNEMLHYPVEGGDVIQLCGYILGARPPTAYASFWFIGEDGLHPLEIARSEYGNGWMLYDDTEKDSVQDNSQGYMGEIHIRANGIEAAAAEGYFCYFYEGGFCYERVDPETQSPCEPRKELYTIFFGFTQEGVRIYGDI